MGSALPALALGSALVALVAGIGGPGGLLYLALYVLASVPGWPVGFALFGRRHAAGWVAGILLGYALTAFGIWGAIRLGHHGPLALATTWTVLAGVTWATAWRPGRQPLVALPPWTRRDTAALCVVLLLAPAICSAPFLKVGARDPDGTRAYRAYFTMDFFWHTALTAEVSKFDSPPRNPYWAQEPLHYYWTYFLLPAAAVGNAPRRLAIEVEPTLLVNALCSGVLLLAMIFLLAWSVVPRAGPVTLAVVLVVLAASAEGAYAVADLVRRGRPLDALRALNVDAVTAWSFRGLRVDGLPRSFWWVPQHATACALALVGLLAASAGGAAARLPVIVLAGCALAASVTMSPFLGAAFSLVFGLAALLAATRARHGFTASVARHAAAAVPVALALVWCVSTGVLEGTSGALKIGWGGLARHAPVEVLLLSLGPALLPALAWLWPGRALPRAALPAVAGLLVGLGLLFFAWIPLDQAYVGFRAGQVILVTLPALVVLAVPVAGDRRGRTVAAWLGLAGLFAVGLPTTLIDWYNAQDTGNRAMGPGFRWTLTVTPQEQEAFAWLRRATPAEAVVQMEPTVRGRDTWTLIPTFGQRRMAAGLAWSLLQRPEFAQRSARVRRMYETTDAAEAWGIARELGVDYVYLDRTERQAFPEAVLAKFDHHPELFHRAFANDEVRIYAVARGSR